MRPVYDEDRHKAGAEGKLMAKTKNDPARYQKRAISAPKARMATAVNATSAFFTAPMTVGHYLDFRAVVSPKAKPTSGN